MTRARGAAMAAAFLLLAGALAPAPAEAHWADLAVAEIVVGGGEVRMTLTFPTGLAAAADDDGDGRLAAAEVRAHRAALTALLGEHIVLTAGGVPAALAVEPLSGEVPPSLVAPAAPGSSGGGATHSTVQLLYTWPETAAGALTMRYGLFLPGVSTASALATIIRDGTARSHVFTPENTTLMIGGAGRALWAQARSFLVLGVKHILTGYDHVLFLITLLMAGGGMRALVKIVTAFTLAHSVTLSLAVLDVVSLPPRLVESGIALSIAYISAENLWRRERALARRWLVTFGFGLIHGLGFASILRDLAVGGSNLAVSLVSFNLGVEAGQIVIVAAVFGLLAALRRLSWQPLLRRAVSVGAMAAGLAWFVQRAGGL